MGSDCLNTLCAYNISINHKCSMCPFIPNLINDCVCKQTFESFTKTVDIDREFNSGYGSYHQWQEIRNGDLPRKNKKFKAAYKAVTKKHKKSLKKLSKKE